MTRAVVLAAAAALLWAACGAEELSPPRVGGPVRYEIRPTDGTGWNGNGYPVGVTIYTHDSPGGKFRLHYAKDGQHAVPGADKDSDGVPDFVETFAKTFDDVYSHEVTTLGFRPPLDDAIYHDRTDYGGDGRFDVYLQDRGGSGDGYVVVETCKSGPPVQCAGYMVVENDFAEYSYPTPEDGMQILASHEFFHTIQNAYRANLPTTFTEATAVWATEQVYPATDDFEKFLKAFFKEPHRSLDHQIGPGDGFPYGLAIWPDFLDQRFGNKIVQAVFDELSEQGTSTDDLTAIDVVLKRDHKSSLAAAFSEFALWNFFTGSNASSGHKGYKEAASYPGLTPKVMTQAPPYRISGEIAYLSAQYYAIKADKGTTIRVEVERPQPQLALHLISRNGDTINKIESIMPDKTSVELESPGALYIVVASTARQDRHLPLSLAVRQVASTPKPGSDAGVDASTDPGGESEGCAVAGTGGGGGAALALCGLALLGLLRRRRKALVGLLGALALVAAGCSDDSTPVDAAPADTTDVDASVDTTPQPDGPAPLAVGELKDFTDDGTGSITGSVPAEGGETYIALLISLNPTPQKLYDYTAKQLTNTSEPLALPTGHASAPDQRDEAQQAPARRCSFHARLQALLDSRPQTLTTIGLRAGPRPRAAGAPPKVGDKRKFTISNGTAYVQIDAEAVQVDGVAAYWLDKTTTPLATVEAKILQEVADGFSKIVVPRERVFFGQESDVDGDGRIAVLFSPLVAQSATAYVQPCDLLDPTVVAHCKNGNQMELLYVSPPNLLPTHMSSALALLETIAHEFQHAIYFYRKYVLNNLTTSNENPYITEGLSALAQDLTGYQAGNLFVTLAALQNIDVITTPSLTNKAISSYVQQPYDGYLRGGAYLINRYLYDLAGGDSLDSAGTPVDKGGIKWLRAFVDSADAGDTLYEKSTGLTLPVLIEQFWTAMAVSNRGPGGAPISTDKRYNFLPTATCPLTKRDRGCNLFGPTPAPMSLTGPKLQAFDKADGKLRSGGAEFLELKAAASATAVGIEIKTKPEAKAKLRLIRIK